MSVQDNLLRDGIIDDCLQGCSEAEPLRGPLRIYCAECKDFKPANSISLPSSLNEGKRRFSFLEAPDIAWFRRLRRCSICHKEFLTGEVNEALIEELLELRQKEKRRRLADFEKIGIDLRARRKWLDSTGNDVPYELATELVRESAWWLTHSSGRPVRAPGHAGRVQRLYCGWSIEFGANWFAAGRALTLARDYVKSVISLAAQGNRPQERELRRHIRSIPVRCVLNVNLDFYDVYPMNDAGELVFGAQAIDVNDCERILMRVTGLNDLLIAYEKIEAKD